jgi:hypothetical protein
LLQPPLEWLKKLQEQDIKIVGFRMANLNSVVATAPISIEIPFKKAIL